MRIWAALAGITLLAGPTQALAATENEEVVIGLIIIVVLLAIYFLPTTIACRRNIAMGCGTMFLLNLFLGWTVIGWLFMIGIAACAKTTAEDNYYRNR